MGRGERSRPTRVRMRRPSSIGLSSTGSERWRYTSWSRFTPRLGWFRGGFIGVDAFYVLSGFLVTSILLGDLRTTGSINWPRFYARRVRRLLPAALLALLVTAIAYSAVASPTEMQDALGGFRAAFLYVANWFFIRQSTDYFAAGAVGSNPVLHFWSLAVEEQFYILWPALLGGLYFVAKRTGRQRWVVLRGFVLALGIVSAIEALYIARTNLDHAYYGTDTRAYQLLAGAFLALTPQLFNASEHVRRPARVCAALAVVALVFVGTAALDLGPISRGVVAAVLTAVVIVALGDADGGAARGFLSWRPLTYLGRVSYGTYLWHWPVVVLVTHDRDIDPVPLFLLATLGATGLAMLSFHLLERPVRTSRPLDRVKLPVIAVGLVSSALMGLLVMPAILDRTSSSVAAQSISTGTKTGLRLLDWRTARADVPKLPDCLHAPIDRCAAVRGGGRRVLLVGDSVARMWLPTFTEIAKRESFQLSVAIYPGCPWQRGLQYAGAAVVTRQCDAHQQDWYDRVVPQYAPDIVVLAQGPYDDPIRSNRFLGPDGRVVDARSDQFEPFLQARSADSLRALMTAGRRIVIIEPTPRPPDPFDPLSCISEGRSRCTYQTRRGPTHLEQFFRQSASPPQIVTLDLDRVVCPRLPTCDPIVDDIIVKRDVNHLTATFARSRAAEVDNLLRRTHVLG